MTPRESRPLTNRTAVVTGSVGSGIGRSIALSLAEAGANVVLNHGTSGSDRSEAVQQLLRAIEALPGKAIHVAADTRTEEGVAAITAAAIKAFGEVDILVNNAGAPWLEQDFTEIDAQRWTETLAAEIIGPSLLIKALLPAMRQKRWGRIINITIDQTALSVLLNHSYAHSLEKFPFPFAIGKLGRSELTRQLAHSEWRYGITINNICPGIIEDMTFEAASNSARGTHEGPSALVTPADISEIALLLCSEAMKHVTGSDIVVPGNVFSRLR